MRDITRRTTSTPPVGSVKRDLTYEAVTLIMPLAVW